MSRLWLCLLFLIGIEASIDVDRRIDCYPEGGATQTLCEARGCIWDDVTLAYIGLPACSMKSDEIGYSNGTREVDGTYTLTKNNGPKNPWGDDFSKIKFSMNFPGNGVVNVRIDSENRYDPAAILDFPRETIPSSESLSVNITSNDPFSFQVLRISDGARLFDTSIGGLIFSDKFIQIAALLPSENMYGWGENIHQSLKHDFSRYTSWAMLSRGDAPNSAELSPQNLYGVHPFYLLVEPSGKSHGVFILNTNAQEVTTLPAPGLVYRTIGGLLDMYFFPGPTPSDVIAQYHAFIGRPFMPAYWSLGYQLCRWGYSSLDDLKGRVKAVMDLSIPIDVVFADIDYMDERKDFSLGNLWNGFGDYVDQLHDWGMKSILIFDPAIEADYDVFQRAKSANISFIEWDQYDNVQREIQDLYPMANDSKIMLGLVWPNNHVAFPDFLDMQNNTAQWWQDEFQSFHKKVNFDGAWIDMNEPQAFGTKQIGSESPRRSSLSCPKSGSEAEWDVPPYGTQAVFYYGNESFLAAGSLCMSAVTQRGNEQFYNTRNLYGWSESRVTADVMPKTTGKRPVIIARSTFASSGRYAGHWLGDNTASWNDLRTTITGVMEFNMFGLPYVGSDVCGYHLETTEELCLRWQQLGSFHSFFRNHNEVTWPYQDPAVWPETVAVATKKANEFRYQYLPYLYTLHYRATTKGETVVRPLFFEYPKDQQALNTSYEFMWGSNILVAPVYTQGATSVDAYIPADNYYSLYDYNYGTEIPTGHSNFSAPTTFNTPTFVRANSIIPRHQNSALTTSALKTIPFSLLIVPTKDGVAIGNLFWDDGDAIIDNWENHDYLTADLQYNAADNGTDTLAINVNRGVNSISAPPLVQLEIFDYPTSPDYSSFTLTRELSQLNVAIWHGNNLPESVFDADYESVFKRCPIELRFEKIDIKIR